jgi:hypothetical protein
MFFLIHFLSSDYYKRRRYCTNLSFEDICYTEDYRLQQWQREAILPDSQYSLAEIWFNTRPQCLLYLLKGAQFDATENASIISS